MPEQHQKVEESGSAQESAYEAPVVEDIGTTEGPAVTAAGVSKDV
jgi:hypothetical protein